MTHHVLWIYRGGCWYITAANARVANRNRRAPGYRFFSLGFRLVISAEA